MNKDLQNNIENELKRLIKGEITLKIFKENISVNDLCWECEDKPQLELSCLCEQCFIKNKLRQLENIWHEILAETPSSYPQLAQRIKKEFIKILN